MKKLMTGLLMLAMLSGAACTKSDTPKPQTGDTSSSAAGTENRPVDPGTNPSAAGNTQTHGGPGDTTAGGASADAKASGNR